MWHIMRGYIILNKGSKQFTNIDNLLKAKKLCK
jgi:hypothetical protein